MTRPLMMLGASLAVSLASPAVAQPQGGDGGSQICTTQQHYSQFPDGWTCRAWGWVTEHDWYNVVVDGEDILTFEGKGNWNQLDAYFCGYTACGQIVPPNPYEYTEETEVEVCLTVGVTINSEASASLRLKLLAELGIQVQAGWNIEVNGCFRKRWSQTYSLGRFQCYPTKWREVWTRRTLNGYVEEAAQRITWRVRTGPGCTGDWQSVVTYCGHRRTNGEADDTSGLHIQQPPVFDPDEDIPPDDPYDGIRLHPCCDGMDENPPCCGCWAVP